MRASEAFKALTKEGRAECIRQVMAVVTPPPSEDYLKQVLQDLRKHPCSDEISRAISGFFRGYVMVDVSPAEATGVKPE